MMQLKADMSSSSIQQEISNNASLAQKLGIRGTPAFIFRNNKTQKVRFVPGALSTEQLTAIILQMLGNG